jgi:hypothetical protein
MLRVQKSILNMNSVIQHRRISGIPGMHNVLTTRYTHESIHYNVKQRWPKADIYPAMLTKGKEKKGNVRKVVWVCSGTKSIIDDHGL